VTGLEWESKRVMASEKASFSEVGTALKQALGSEPGSPRALGSGLGSLWALASGYPIGRNQIEENPPEEDKPRC
jgi:hypothetical protein